jgi:opacity protein-like surface antigen
MRRALLIAAFLSLVMSAVSTARAEQTVWSGIVIANNVPQPTPMPAELKRIEQTLKELFGYNQFAIIGQSAKTLRTGEEDWLASSKYFSLHVDSRGETEAGYVLNLKLFKEAELLLETETKLSKQSPLVIKGPQVGDGQLVLVLIVDEERNQPAQSQHIKRRHSSSNEFLTAWHRLKRAIRDALP